MILSLSTFDLEHYIIYSSPIFSTHNETVELVFESVFRY